MNPEVLVMTRRRSALAGNDRLCDLDVSIIDEFATGRHADRDARFLVKKDVRK